MDEKMDNLRKEKEEWSIIMEKRKNYKKSKENEGRKWRKREEEDLRIEFLLKINRIEIIELNRRKIWILLLCNEGKIKFEGSEFK